MALTHRSSRPPKKRNKIARKFCHLVDTKSKETNKYSICETRCFVGEVSDQRWGNFNGCNVRYVDQKWLVCVNKPFVVRLKNYFDVCFFMKNDFRVVDFLLFPTRFVLIDAF